MRVQALAQKAHDAKAQVVAATDLLALTMIQPPSEWGADICVGSAQRFGVPMGYGGPHAAFLACDTQHKRLLPGRIIGTFHQRLACKQSALDSGSPDSSHRAVSLKGKCQLDSSAFLPAGLSLSLLAMA